MRHFINKDMAALNVSTIPVDTRIVDEFDNYEGLPGKRSIVSPPWKSDLRWVSAADEEAFDAFQSAFDRLGIAGHFLPYLDVEREVRLYAGFLVVRSQCGEAHFHLDWIDANNEAFTLLTPVSSNAADFGLLYEKLGGGIGEYDYRRGEAIVFGDKFVHSTKPGSSSEPVVLLCFEFGTDKMEHWPKIYPTVGYQLTHICQPDGRFVATEPQSGRSG
ncbi:MAG TPA: hypothetical protein VFL74_04455 [Sphingomicrobium sp.]|jgi:hypothetical protein|nr:hypothetical protein [Sphingomicrobium sp.]